MPRGHPGEEAAAKLGALGIDQTLLVSENQLLQIDPIPNNADTEDAKTQRINEILGE